MLKLNASYSKKVPVEGQQYSSQSYHATIEIEIPDGLSQEQLQTRIHDTFELVKDSVETELRNGNGVAKPADMPARNQRNGNSTPKASGKQITYLTDLAVRLKMDVTALNAEAMRRFNVPDINQLNRKQASELIDSLGEAQRKAA